VRALVVGLKDMVRMATLDRVETDHNLLAAALVEGRAAQHNLAARQGQEGEAEAEDSLEAEVGDSLEVGAEDMPYYHVVQASTGSWPFVFMFLPSYS
jgi:hypothetical protein